MESLLSLFTHICRDRIFMRNPTDMPFRHFVYLPGQDARMGDGYIRLFLY